SGEPAPGDVGVYRATLRGSGDKGGWERIAVDDGPHVASAVRGGNVLVLSTSTLGRGGEHGRVRVRGDHRARLRAAVLGEPHHGDAGAAAPRLLHTGARRIPAAVL
ncbi:S9 family peptidase, partial [Streptomyces daliensis]|nr:S9 family peptidase [Streptomyces daliensis]